MILNCLQKRGCLGGFWGEVSGGAASSWGLQRCAVGHVLHEGGGYWNASVCFTEPGHVLQKKGNFYG